jgi:hypothetical protein
MFDDELQVRVLEGLWSDSKLTTTSFAVSSDDVVVTMRGMASSASPRLFAETPMCVESTFGFESTSAATTASRISSYTKAFTGSGP